MGLLCHCVRTSARSLVLSPSPLVLVQFFVLLLPAAARNGRYDDKRREFDVPTYTVFSAGAVGEVRNISCSSSSWYLLCTIRTNVHTCCSPRACECGVSCPRRPLLFLPQMYLCAPALLVTTMMSTSYTVQQCCTRYQYCCILLTGMPYGISGHPPAPNSPIISVYSVSPSQASAPIGTKHKAYHHPRAPGTAVPGKAVTDFANDTRTAVRQQYTGILCTKYYGTSMRFILRLETGNK